MAVYRSLTDHHTAASTRRCSKQVPMLLRNTVFGMLVAVLSTLTAACSAIPTATTEPDPVRLQLNWVHSPEFAGYYVAEAKGFYAENNLSVEISERDPDSDVPPRQKLVDDDADFAVLSSNRMQNLIEEGADPIVSSAIFQISPTVFFALKETGIHHPREMVGKKIGIKSNSWRQRVHDTLAQVGIDPSEIVEVEVDFDAMDLLYDGSVDVWTGYINDEVVETREKGYDVDLIFPSDYAVGDYDGLITQLRADMERDSDLTERFVRASLRGWEYAIQNPQEAGAIVAGWVDQHDVEFYQAAVHELVPLVDTGQVPIGWIDDARWKRELGDNFDEAIPHYNLDGLLSIPANRNWISTVAQ